ncbi:MAG: lysoplasmalogenase [Candidatus Aminicenantes bacterium]|jgi:Predicted membrane protein|nr:lysoplasmalogenase [Candidatus Aminicenantes bacterium]
MDINTAAFIFSAMVSGLAAIVSDYRGQFWLAYFFRPFTIMLMIGLLFEARPISFYRNAIMIGLVFSLLGEVMMMLKQKKFLAGLIFFLLTQISLSVAFFSQLHPGFLTWPAIILAILAGLILFLIWPRLSSLKLPIIIYLLGILTMVRLALELPHQLQGLSPWLAATGALLFFFSDCLIAINRFYRKWAKAQIFILLFFYLGLLLITLSV